MQNPNPLIYAHTPIFTNPNTLNPGYVTNQPIKKEESNMVEKITSFKKGFIETKDNEQKEICIIEQTGKDPTPITQTMFNEIKATMKW